MSAVGRTTVLIVVLLTAAAGLAWDLTSAPLVAATEATEPVALDVPTSGAVYCPAVAGEDEDVTVAVTAVPPAMSAGDGDRARVRLEAGDDVIDEFEVTPQAPAEVDVTGAAASRPLTISWSGSPVVATYTTTGERPIIQRCEATTAPTWYLSGFTTTLGNNAVLHLFNPFSVDAVAQVRYTTNEGAVDLVTTQDIAVPAGEAAQVDLDEVQPEVADLGVVVEVLSGRLVASGELLLAPPDEESDGVRGRTVITATAEPALEHVFPYSAIAEGSAYAWIQVMNPSDREAMVLFSVSAPDAGAPPAEEVAVPPGGTVRLDLRGRSERATFSTDVTVANDVPVVATRIATRRSGEVTAADAGTSTGVATEWVLSGVGTGNGAGRVDVYNPGGEPATVTLMPQGRPTPDAWREIAIEPNGQRGIRLSDLGEEVANLGLELTSDVPVGVSVRTEQENGGPEGFRTVAGFTDAAWSGLAVRPTTTHDPDLDRDPLPTSSAAAVPSAGPAAGADVEPS